jgi:hypothetical protein
MIYRRNSSLKMAKERSANKAQQREYEPSKVEAKESKLTCWCLSLALLITWVLPFCYGGGTLKGTYQHVVKPAAEAVKPAAAAMVHQLPESVQQKLNTMLNETIASFKLPADRPGKRLAASGVRAKHPVLIVPGMTSSGLELWRGKSCAADNFRERVWGSTVSQWTECAW